MFAARAVVFLILAVFLFFLGGATSVGWVRIVDSLLWGMLGLSLLLQWLSVTAVDARRRLLRAEHDGSGPGPMEDDTVEVELEVINWWFWPRFFVSLAYEAPMERPSSRLLRFFVANLSGHGSVPLTSRIRCYRRGLHHFGPVSVESQVPFGLFRRRKRRAAPLSILVYPRVYPLRRLTLVEGSRGLSNSPQKARSGQEVVGSRYYTPGDPLKHIHWPNTARLRRLAVKEMEDTAERALTVAFDTRQAFGLDRETTLEYSIKLAASVELYALKKGESVQLLAGELQGEWTDVEAYLRELALLEASPESPGLASALDTVPGSAPVMALVAAEDRDGMAAVERNAPRLPGMVAVVLKGFGEEDARTGAIEPLQRSGVPAIVCEPGALTETIRALEGAGATTADAIALASTPGAPVAP